MLFADLFFVLVFCCCWTAEAEVTSFSCVLPESASFCDVRIQFSGLDTIGPSTITQCIGEGDTSCRTKECGQNVFEGASNSTCLQLDDNRCSSLQQLMECIWSVSHPEWHQEATWECNACFESTNSSRSPLSSTTTSNASQADWDGELARIRREGLIFLMIYLSCASLQGVRMFMQAYEKHKQVQNSSRQFSQVLPLVVTKEGETERSPRIEDAVRAAVPDDAASSRGRVSIDQVTEMYFPSNTATSSCIKMLPCAPPPQRVISVDLRLYRRVLMAVRNYVLFLIYTLIHFCEVFCFPISCFIFLALYMVTIMLGYPPPHRFALNNRLRVAGIRVAGGLLSMCAFMAFVHGLFGELIFYSLQQQNITRENASPGTLFVVSGSPIYWFCWMLLFVTLLVASITFVVAHRKRGHDSWINHLALKSLEMSRALLPNTLVAEENFASSGMLSIKIALFFAPLLEPGGMNTTIVGFARSWYAGYLKDLFSRANIPWSADLKVSNEVAIGRELWTMMKRKFGIFRWKATTSQSDKFSKDLVDHLRRYLEKKGDINFRGPTGITLLHWYFAQAYNISLPDAGPAASTGGEHDFFIEFLLENGADPNVLDRGGRPALCTRVGNVRKFGVGFPGGESYVHTTIVVRSNLKNVLEKKFCTLLSNVHTDVTCGRLKTVYMSIRDPRTIGFNTETCYWLIKDIIWLFCFVPVAWGLMGSLFGYNIFTLGNVFSWLFIVGCGLVGWRTYHQVTCLLLESAMLYKVLQPSITWNEVENALLTNHNAPIDRLLGIITTPRNSSGDTSGRDAIVAAANQMHILRLRDLLCCELEGNESELCRRRKLMWENVIRPMTELCQTRPLEKYERSALTHIWEILASVGVGSLLPDMVTVVESTMIAFENILGKEERLLKSLPLGDLLFARPAEYYAVGLSKFQQSRFVRPPAWAVKRDLFAAVADLARLGVFASPEDVCKLFGAGENALFLPIPLQRPDVFADHHKDVFWMGLVVIWLLALHRKVETDFRAAILGLIDDKEQDCLTIPSMKGFNRCLTKAQEYAAKGETCPGDQVVLLPLRVIDILRCAFVFDTPERALRFEAELLARLPLARSKNLHHQEAKTMGGYADRKFNVVLSGSTDYGGTCISLLVEVQQLFTGYARVKKQMHGCYRLARGDYTNGKALVRTRSGSERHNHQNVALR